MKIRVAHVVFNLDVNVSFNKYFSFFGSFFIDTFLFRCSMVKDMTIRPSLLFPNYCMYNLFSRKKTLIKNTFSGINVRMPLKKLVTQR